MVTTHSKYAQTRNIVNDAGDEDISECISIAYVYVYAHLRMRMCVHVGYKALITFSQVTTELLPLVGAPTQSFRFPFTRPLSARRSKRKMLDK